MDHLSPNAIKTQARRSSIELAREIKALDDRWRRIKRNAAVGLLTALVLAPALFWVCLPYFPSIIKQRIHAIANG